MGTASTMACVAEALGITLPGGASPPAVTADRIRIAERTGATAVAMAISQLTPARILSAKAFENALRVLLAIGGSTNGIIHLTAIAGRLGIDLELDRLDALGRDTPVLVDLKPSGLHYMEDFHKAGGMPALLRELRPLLHLDALTVTGRSLGEELDHSGAGFAQDVIRTRANPIYPQGGIAVLRGNLAPGGALIKQSAADPKLFEREGRAVVFASLDDLAARIDSPDLDVKPDDFLVLQNAGPKSGYAMPEAGYLPIPMKLSRAGVKDMVRISDARMSGTAFGTVVLHVSPESAIGGPLALVKNGDRIRLSVSQRKLDLLVDDAELARRRGAHRPLQLQAKRGYASLYIKSVLQAEHGCDFDFLRKA
jgi:dihydroxy-acid dehydratase